MKTSRSVWGDVCGFGRLIGMCWKCWSDFFCGILEIIQVLHFTRKPGRLREMWHIRWKWCRPSIQRVINDEANCWKGRPISFWCRGSSTPCELNFYSKLKAPESDDLLVCPSSLALCQGKGFVCRCWEEVKRPWRQEMVLWALKSTHIALPVVVYQCWAVQLYYQTLWIIPQHCCTVQCKILPLLSNHYSCMGLV